MQDIQIKEYLHQVWKRRKVALAFLAGIMVVTALFTYQQTPIYRASTTVEIGTETPDVAFFQDVVNTSPYGWWSALRYYETQYQIIKSRNLLHKVAQRGLRDSVVTGFSLDVLVSHLQGGISVKADENSRMANIYFDDNDPDRAQKLSILIAEVYVDENLRRKLAGVEDAVNWLNARLLEVREEKAKQEDKLQKYKEEFKIVSLPDRDSSTKSNLVALTESLNQLKGRRIELEAQYNKLNELVKQSERVEDLLGVVASDLLTKLKHDLANIRAQKSQLTHRYLEKHPEIVRLNAEAAEIGKLIQLEVENEVSRLRTRYLLAKAEEDSISKALEKQKIEAIRLDEVNRTMADIQIMTSTNQQIYETLQKKIKEADLSALVRSNNIRVVDNALKPTSPIRPNVKANMLLAFLVGLLGGVALALVLEYVDDTIKTHEDVETYLKHSVLALIPHYETSGGNGIRKRLEFVPIEAPTTVVAEFYRTLRTNVLFLSRTKQHNRILVVSTGPSEGKTVTAVNLAVTFSQVGLRTIVIDLDFRRPRLHTYFRNVNQMGLTNVLVGEVKLDQAITKSHVDNLDYLAAGSIPPNPAEILSSLGLKETLDELSRRYEYVIMDSSPIAPVTDAIIISQLVHGVILVVRAGKTHRRAVVFANEQLKAVSAQILGVVLNDVDIEKSTYGSYQYYKYGYSTYGPDEKKDEKKNEKEELAEEAPAIIS